MSRRAAALLTLCALMVSGPVSAAEPAPVGPEPAEAPDAPTPEEGQAPVIVPPRPLSEVAATYPPGPFEEGVEADVVLTIDVLVDGAVGEISVKVPAGQGFDEAAVEAVRRMTFAPATVDGVPTAVRISYTYRFRIQRVEEPAPEPAPEPVVVARGDVRERGTRKPLVGVAVILVETGESFVTDEDGRFEIRAAGPGTWTVEVPLDAYKPYRKTFTVAEGQVEKVPLRLTRDIYADYRTVIKRPEIETEVAKKSIQAAEIQKIPGTSGDALKVVQLLPGVARGLFGTGDPIIRGSSPEDTQTFMQGLLLPQLFHFGGLYSVINTDLLQTIDYWPGGFSARFGQATGGIIDVTLRPLKTDRWHGSIETNVFHTAVLAEGPIGDKTAVALAARRSYIDVLLPAILNEDTLDIKTAPRYYDYQLRVTHQISEVSDLALMAYGSDDELVLILEEPQGPGGVFGGRLGTKSLFHLLTGTWTRQLSDDVKLELSWSNGYQRFSFDVGSEFKLDVKLAANEARLEVDWEVDRDFILTAGLQGSVSPFFVDFRGSAPPKEGEGPSTVDPTAFVRQSIDGVYRFVSPYLEGTLRLGETLVLAPGLRVDYVSTGNASYVSVDPRLNVRWTPVERTTLKLFAGMYHKAPEFDEWDPKLGTTALGPEEAIQVSVGVEQRFDDFITADLQVFYKHMRDLVVSADAANEGVNYTNEGIGRVYGMELLLRHDVGRRFFGWLSYTLMKAERRDHVGDDWRPFDFDQTHILSLVGVVRLGRGWEVGTRFRYTTGNPDTPVTGATYDADNDSYIPTVGVINSDRISSFHQLDVRFDKKWVFDTWILNLYLEFQNIYNHRNIEAIDYTFDYAEKDPIKGLPLIPNFGVKAEF